MPAENNIAINTDTDVDKLLKSIEISSKQCKKHEGYVNLGSQFVLALGLFAAALAGAVTFSAFFGFSLSITILVFISGLLVDFQIYSNKLPKLFNIIFMRNIFEDIEVAASAWQLQNNEEDEKRKEAIKKENEKYLDKWLYLRKSDKRSSKSSPGWEKRFLGALEVLQELAKLKDRPKLTKLTEEEKHFINYCIEREKNLKRALPPLKELIFKRVAIIVGIILSLLTGLGIFAIAYSNLQPFLLSFAAFNSTAALLASISISTTVGSLWALVTYKTVHSAIKKNIFKQCLKKFHDQRHWLGKMMMIVIALMGIVTIFVSCGAYATAVQGLGLSAAVALAYGIAILLPRATFMVKHAVSVVANLGELKWKDLKAWPMKDNPSSHIGWAILKVLLGILLFAATCLHVAAEVVLNMGAKNDNLFVDRFFAYFNFSYGAIKKAIFGIGSTIELLEHLDFVSKFIDVLKEKLFSDSKKNTNIKADILLQLKTTPANDSVKRTEIARSEIINRPSFNQFNLFHSLQLPRRPNTKNTKEEAKVFTVQLPLRHCVH